MQPIQLIAKTTAPRGVSIVTRTHVAATPHEHREMATDTGARQGINSTHHIDGRSGAPRTEAAKRGRKRSIVGRISLHRHM